jgi:cation transport regulator ChaB
MGCPPVAPVVFAGRMFFRLDQLGKNILRDFFVLVGAVETEVEVPAGDAQRIDLWHVPDPELLRAHPEIEPGLLRSMAAEPGMVEVWSAAPDVPDFLECVRKHHQWHHTLELRAGRPTALPPAWLVSAGRPDAVLREFGFVPDVAVVSSGLYTTGAPGWRVHIIVIAELPRIRSTVLLRLLGSARVRRLALRDLASLPEEAWERRVAFPWLIRLSFEVPAEVVAGLPREERDLIMETREWYEQFNARRLNEAMQEALPRAVKEALPKAVKEALPKAVQEALPKAVQEALPKAVKEALPKAVKEALPRAVQEAVQEVLPKAVQEGVQEALSKAKESWQLETVARLCGRRLGRSLTEAEHVVIADRLNRLGEERVEDVILSSSADALAIWLADLNAT